MEPMWKFQKFLAGWIRFGKLSRDSSLDISCKFSPIRSWFFWYSPSLPQKHMSCELKFILLAEKCMGPWFHDTKSAATVTNWGIRKVEPPWFSEVMIRFNQRWSPLHASPASKSWRPSRTAEPRKRNSALGLAPAPPCLGNKVSVFWVNGTRSEGGVRFLSLSWIWLSYDKLGVFNWICQRFFWVISKVQSFGANIVWLVQRDAVPSFIPTGWWAVVKGYCSYVHWHIKLFDWYRFEPTSHSNSFKNRRYWLPTPYRSHCRMIGFLVAKKLHPGGCTTLGVSEIHVSPPLVATRSHKNLDMASVVKTGLMIPWHEWFQHSEASEVLFVTSWHKNANLKGDEIRQGPTSTRKFCLAQGDSVLWNLCHLIPYFKKKTKSIHIGTRPIRGHLLPALEHVHAQLTRAFLLQKGWHLRGSNPPGAHETT